MMHALLTDENVPFVLFGTIDSTRRPGIKENALYWIAGVCTLTLLAKFAWVLWWRHSG
jgi:hypothetical protein